VRFNYTGPPLSKSDLPFGQHKVLDPSIRTALVSDTGRLIEPQEQEILDLIDRCALSIGL
jgi:hypothetical protein